jgi:transcriptional regulator of acetoin/glycerol metabolism
MNTKTLSFVEEPARGVRRTEHLYRIVDAARPGGGARYALDDVDAIELGRGGGDATHRVGRTLRVDAADPWMSSTHARLERDGNHWVAVDAGSRNGILIRGQRHDRVALLANDVFQLGRTFFALRGDEPAGEPVLELADGGDAFATLHAELAHAFAELARVAATTLPILVGGPTGAGKDRIAQGIHRRSGRDGAFVAVNCAALPAPLVESELFGHRRGAFSGATADHAGLVLASDRGTLFLDEIGDLPPAAQAALLRVLEAREVRAVGATSATPVDLRVVAATHRDLDAMVASGAFREDLLARLAGFCVEVPPLCERLVDLGLVLGQCLPAGTTLSPSAMAALFGYAWPRNIRELVLVLERARAVSGGGEIAAANLPAEITAPPARDGDKKRELVELLRAHHGNVSQVAVAMGVLRQQVQRWIRHYAIDAKQFRT